MTNASDLQEPGPAMHTDSPGNVPTQRPSSLDRLDVLVGEWQMEASFAAGFFGSGTTAITDRGGRTTFEWLEGRFFLIQRVGSDQPDAPSLIAIIGTNEGQETFSQHYYDSRGVARVYHMSLDGGVWKLWREAPGFWQRYTGLIADDGSRITGAWEKSVDGREWEHDFDLSYIKRV